MAKAKPIAGLDAHATTGVNARMIARVRLEELCEWAQYVHDPARILELHNMRIAAKRLRYTLEIFAEALPVAVAPVIEELTQVQDELGVVHDSDVMLRLLHLCTGDGQQEQEQEQVEVNGELLIHLLNPAVAPSEEERRGLELYIQTVQRQRAERYAAFRAHWQQLTARDFQGEVQTLLEA